MTRRNRLAAALLAAQAALVAALPAQVAPALDLSIGAKSGARRAAVSLSPLLAAALGPVSAGIGLRATGYGGDAAPYTNRDATSGAFTATLPIAPAVYGLNVAVTGGLRITPALGLGANLDVIGVATGSSRTLGTLTAKPQAFSYFRYGSADHGALNSEFFASLRVAPRLQVRGGFSHYVTDYEVTDSAAPASGTRRYQRFESVLFAAAAVRF